MRWAASVANAFAIAASSVTRVAPPAPPPRPTAAGPYQTATDRPEPAPARTGVLVGIATIAMSFAALTSSLVVRQAASSDWRHFQLPTILYVNTLVLLASSVTIETSRRQVARRLSWLYLTLALGLMFVAGQLLAWRNLAAQGLFLATSPSSAFFYIFSALHGLHLLGGAAGLVYALHRLQRATAPAGATALGAAALYWHFMAVLWIYLLAVLTLRI